MELPPLELDTSWAGAWNRPQNIEALIPGIAHRYFKRHQRFMYSDADDLEQEARLAFWLWLQEKGGAVERVRELEAFSVIHSAMWSEIEYTRRLRVEDAEQDAINWRLVVQPDRNLTPHQKRVLVRFRNAASVLARRPNWESLWLVKGLEWEPAAVTLYLRSKVDDRHACPPDKVLKRVKKAEGRIRKGLPAGLLQEVLHLSLNGNGS